MLSADHLQPMLWLLSEPDVRTSQVPTNPESILFLNVPETSTLQV